MGATGTAGHLTLLRLFIVSLLLHRAQRSIDGGLVPCQWQQQNSGEAAPGIRQGRGGGPEGSGRGYRLRGRANETILERST